MVIDTSYMPAFARAVPSENRTFPSASFSASTVQPSGTASSASARSSAVGAVAVDVGEGVAEEDWAEEDCAADCAEDCAAVGGTDGSPPWRVADHTRAATRAMMTAAATAIIVASPFVRVAGAPPAGEGGPLGGITGSDCGLGVGLSSIH